ncbi:hypothetical protein BAUCODRAFT_151830 [Baudoinia panamericana UAMH 10762]|uniref:Uncharacterized protein n=1 Tax=Baudoinia panamericana (strain UAMH 10762) TaxID=717646 RepID=M2MM36_BAUPA|nr:uncharacterized protein BAUCODRAFT_151830 [Baudoinia panamericana UAMH 10762]EMC92438.1 hypothetical protein BAUCODRAFT_151830 [Baudoinia panamericana UAMH 10762]
MDFATNIMDHPPPAYIVYWDVASSNPSTPPVFFPPKDSDELFDALRGAFPHLRTHSERMREAMIQFLVEERQAEQFRTASVDTLSPTEHSWPSMTSSGSTSTLSSPDTLALGTPAFGMSPQPQLPHLSRTQSMAPSMTTTTSTGESSPSLENMTGVFSISSTGQPKQKTRRKMTEAEKVEYRKRRIVKACEVCAKRKRKCIHNQPGMETLASQQKVTKKASPTAPSALSAKATVLENTLQKATWSFDGIDAGNDEFAADMQLFDDFDILPDETTFRIDDDQTKASADIWKPNVVARPRGDDYAMDAYGDNADFADIPGMDPWFDVNMGQLRWGGTVTQGQLPHGQHEQALTPASPNAAMSADNGNSANGMLWEHLRTGQDESISTHEPAARGSYTHEHASSDGHGGSGRWQPRNSAGVLAQTVVQVNGTARAIRAFGRLLKSNMPQRIALQLVRLTSVADAIAQASLSGAPYLTANADLHNTPTPRQQVGGSAAGPLEGMRIGDYLRMKTNFDNVAHQMGRGGQALPSMTATQQQPGSRSLSTTSSMRAAPTSTPISSRTSPQEGNSAAHDQGRPPATFGGSITSIITANQTHVLKRRIPKSLHSIVDRNNANASEEVTLAPILQTERDMYRQPQELSKNSINAHQANGGAYLRLGSDNHPHFDSRLLSGDPAIDRWLDKLAEHKAAQTDARVLRTTNNSANRAVPVHRYSKRTEITQKAPQVLASGMRTSKDSSSRVDGQDEVYIPRNRDTFRRRDHFGRITPTTSASELELEPAATESSNGGGDKECGSGVRPFHLPSWPVFALLTLFTLLSNLTLSFSPCVMASIWPVSKTRASTEAKVWPWHNPRQKPRYQVEDSAWSSMLSQHAIVNGLEWFNGRVCKIRGVAERCCRISDVKGGVADGYQRRVMGLLAT